MSNEVQVTTPSRDEDLIQNGGFWAASHTTEIIQAHAGSISKFGDTYYWYGEDKRHNGARLRAVSIYASNLHSAHLGRDFPAIIGRAIFR